MKKITAMMLTMILFFNAFIPSVHADTILNDVEILADTQHERVARSYDDEYVYISTLNKESNTLTNEQLDKETEELISETTIDLNEVNIIGEKNEIQFRAGGRTNQNTFSNYEYTINYGSPNRWELRRPREGGFNNTYYIERTENYRNRTNLNNFRNKVEDINSQEKKLAGALVGASFSSILTIILSTTPGALPTALTASGLAGTAFNLAIDLKRMCNDANHYYYEVKNS